MTSDVASSVLSIAALRWNRTRFTPYPSIVRLEQPATLRLSRNASMAASSRVLG